MNDMIKRIDIHTFLEQAFQESNNDDSLCTYLVVGVQYDLRRNRVQERNVHHGALVHKVNVQLFLGPLRVEYSRNITG